MKHHEHDHLLTLAKIGQDFPQSLPRDKRLRRWVDLLDGDPHGYSRRYVRRNISRPRYERHCIATIRPLRSAATICG
jgi:hypothetical protein